MFALAEFVSESIGAARDDAIQIRRVSQEFGESAKEVQEWRANSGLLRRTGEQPALRVPWPIPRLDLTASNVLVHRSAMALAHRYAS